MDCIQETKHIKKEKSFKSGFALVLMISCCGCTEYEKCPRDMVFIPEGEFIMGSDPSDPASSSEETPKHTVYLSKYCIDKYEVTNIKYSECEVEGACTRPRITDPPSYYEQDGYERYPVLGVTWDQAKAYCSWAEKRLPTEAEWEKAARGSAPNERTYPWGNSAEALMEPASKCPLDNKVGSFPDGVSPFGVHDMAGSVPEIVNDWYDNNYYSVSPSVDPQGPTNGTNRVVRGMPCCPCVCAISFPISYRVSARYWCQDREIDHIGFRCARKPS